MEAITFAATVTDIRLESRAGAAARWQVALDRTRFSATAPSGTLVAVAPSGARLEVPVLGILEDQGTVWHIVGKPLTDGTEVIGTLTDILVTEPTLERGFST
jgi:hypothetical protein